MVLHLVQALDLARPLQLLELSGQVLDPVVARRVRVQPLVQLVHCGPVDHQGQQHDAGDIEGDGHGRGGVHVDVVLDHEAHGESDGASQATIDEDHNLTPAHSVAPGFQYWPESEHHNEAGHVENHVERQQSKSQVSELDLAARDGHIGLVQEPNADHAGGEEDDLVADVPDGADHSVVGMPGLMREHGFDLGGKHHAEDDRAEHPGDFDRLTEEEGAVDTQEQDRELQNGHVQEACTLDPQVADLAGDDAGETSSDGQLDKFRGDAARPRRGPRAHLLAVRRRLGRPVREDEVNDIGRAIVQQTLSFDE
mmetsp:Transcript_116014/g.369061  ORF Transcript_116014/g.369061 Transcript_116014/m.369061 type:complete len:310 (+) Transcript_116014:2557-3486(+)